MSSRKPEGIEIDLRDTRLSDLDPKWRMVLVDSPFNPLTKLDIYAYYYSPKVRRNLYKELKGKPVAVSRRFEEGGQLLFIRHDPKGDWIKIEKAFEDPDDPKDLLYWIHRRTIEFHKTVPIEEGKTDEYVIDVDLGPRADPEKAKQVTVILKKMLQKLPEVKQVKVYFSGGTGFYVVGKLAHQVDVDQARSKLKKLLKELTDQDPMLTLSPPGLGQIRLDLSPMKRGGSYRAPYSINAETGLAAIPLNSDRDILNFEPHQAVPQRITRIPEKIKIWR